MKRVILRVESGLVQSALLPDEVEEVIVCDFDVPGKSVVNGRSCSVTSVADQMDEDEAEQILHMLGEHNEK